VPTASISIADTTLTEIGSPSAFVTAGSGGLDAPFGITLGPNGNLYVACNGGAVRRYNAATGAYLSTFVSQGSGGLSGVDGLAFGPDGNLYVASQGTDQVLRYNGTTGAFMNAFVGAGSGGLDNPRGIAFGPDGNLYVSSFLTHSILRYQGPSGASPGSPLPAPGQSGATFVAPKSGGLFNPIALTFGPDGNLYTDGYVTPGILRFDGDTGAFLDTFVPDSLLGTTGLGLVFDQEGRLYVGDRRNAVHRYDSQGNPLGDLLIASASAPITSPLGLAFDAQGALLISSVNNDAVVRYDRGVVVSLSAANPTPVTVDYATADGTATAAADYRALSGTVTFQPGQTSRRILLATRDDLEAESNETFSVQLSNATGGAVIGTGTGTVLVADEDGTRQLTIGDTSAVEGDHTAHYRGAFITSVREFNGLTFGPDGKVYTSGSAHPCTIRRYDATTGEFLDTFVPAGRIAGVRDIVFRDGYMYVASINSDEVLRFNATTGAFVDAFVTAGSGGIDSPDGMAFGPDANNDGIPELYVTGWNSHSVHRYDGATGQPLGTYITPGSGGLSFPFALAFGPDAVYVTSSGTNQILKYNTQTGTFLGVAASAGINNPLDVVFGPDGLMYVASAGNDRILRFTAAGTYVDDYVPAGAGGMDGLRTLVFGPDGDLYVAATGNPQILRFGTANEAVFTVSISTPSTLPVTVNFATADGTADGSDYAATTGTVTFAPGFTTATVRVPLLDDATVESAQTFAVNLSNPTGAAIADNQGVGTILDNDSTKFFVVDDGGTDRTYRYGLPGNALGNSTMNGSDTAPRGAASNVAGDKVWVVDANKNVYVYNTVGGLLGSWTAGGLNAQAQLEGIATNGTDVWLLDNKLDKVYKYVGGIGAGANRISGTQNAASSFSLNRDNSNGKGMVTDGTSLWVVNDGSSDKVFKYALTGTLLGSWTIDPANAAPTGLTINPASVSDIWVVDSGTDRVYQYTSAAGRTSGSQNAAATFVLAAGNTNPQDIADPPAPGTLFSAVTAFPDANLPASTSFAATSQRETPTSAAIRAPAMQDRIWALAGGELLDWSSRLFLNNPARESFATDPDRAWTSIRLPGGTSPREPLALRSPIGNDAAGPDPDVADLVAGVVAEERQPFEGRDALFALLADDPLHKKAPSPWLST
jgi:WD40 repeat protein